MAEFSLEELSQEIDYIKTKYYFEEVLSSYHNKNYCSAVVMLWSVAVCDIVYKLQNLIDLYEDKSAKTIIRELTELQNSDPKSAAWELKLLDDVNSKTNLLDGAEYENLRYLQKQRHLSAHPTLNASRELHTPNKETVRALIRNTLEGLLTKPPFYTRKVITELLYSLAESSVFLENEEKTRKFLESRYLSKLKPESQVSIFKALWKLTFRTETPECNENRTVNFMALSVINSKNIVEIRRFVEEEKDYYSQISSNPEVLDLLVSYLSKNPEIYALLHEDAKIKINHNIQNSRSSKIFGWFAKASLKNHFDDISSLIETDSKFEFKGLVELQDFLRIRDTEEWQSDFCKILSIYYGSSGSYYRADSRFQTSISPFLESFSKENLIFLVEKNEGNRQTHDRKDAFEDHKKIYQKIMEQFPDEFDVNFYPKFRRNIEPKSPTPQPVSVPIPLVEKPPTDFNFDAF